MKKIIQNLLCLAALPLGVSSNFFYCTLSAQTVQLPSYQRMGASTSVMVPDGGSVNTAGISRSSSGSRSSGTPILPFQNRSYGSSSSTSMMNTSVQIIDLHEMDEQILNSPSSRSVRRPGMPLEPEDHFLRRQRQLENSEFGADNSGLMNARDSIRSRICVQSSDGSLSQEREQLRQSLDLSSRAGKVSDSEKNESDILNEELIFSPKVQSASKPRKSSGAPKSVSEKDNTAVILARKGYAAEKEGKKNLAVSYYQQAEELAKGELLRKIQKRKDLLLGN